MPERLNWRSALLRAAIAVAAFAALGYLAIRLVPGSGARLADASPGWIAVCIALELVACAGFAACFWATFSYAPNFVSRSRCAQIALGELAAFAVVPTGAAAPLIRLWALRGGGMPLRTIFVRSVVHGPLLNVPYATAALLLGLGVVVGAGPGRAPLAVALAPIGIVAVAVAAATAITLAGRRRRQSLDVRGWRRIAREAATIVPEGLRQIPARARHPAAIGGALVWWAGDCAVLWAAFHAVGASPNVAVVALGYMLGQLGTTLPLPGGVGGVEPIMLGVLVASGVEADVGAAAIVVYRAVALGLQSALGAVALSLLIPSVRRERARQA
ncbi:MAG: putative heme transporter [Solirubrobacteraceae bacterium]|jgi:uncharacterized membrane protein YbhN (UPF0104 family)|nr:putative heme transporter [Solirubrobacteraceae bacterium]